MALILRLVAFTLVASLAAAQECPPIDPAEAQRLTRVCEALLDPSTRAAFDAFADQAYRQSDWPGAADKTLLVTALEVSLRQIDSTDAWLLVNTKHCRLNAVSAEFDDCSPSVNLLNSGLQHYDPNNPPAFNLAGLPTGGRLHGHPHRQAQPPAYTELECIAVLSRGEVPPNPSLQRTSPGRSPGRGR
jgi:hypothetical protein